MGSRLVVLRSWRTAYASVIGRSHQKIGTPCQDASCCRVVRSGDGNEILLAIACDGAGSASRSQLGADLTVRLFLEEFEPVVALDPSLGAIDRAFTLRWIAAVRSKIAAQAVAESLPMREFSCTMLAAVVAPERAVFMQIGDGAIVVSSGNEIGDYNWVFWPQHGEFANQTNFVTQDNTPEILYFDDAPRPHHEVAIFTDGIERLVLDVSAKAVHAPALRPIFEWLENTEPNDDGTNRALVAYLGSDHVNKRTDDDKSLVMATRATPQTAPRTDGN
jgi:hypothetical protein